VAPSDGAGAGAVLWPVRAVIESLCMQLPRHGDSMIVCECAQVRTEPRGPMTRQPCVTLVQRPLRPLWRRF
jgi:hypothetical protein